MENKKYWSPANLPPSDLIVIRRIVETLISSLYDRYWFHEHWGLDKVDLKKCLDIWPCKPEDAWIVFACLNSVHEDNEFDKIWKPKLAISKVEFDNIFKRFQES